MRMLTIKAPLPYKNGACLCVCVCKRSTHAMQPWKTKYAGRCVGVQCKQYYAVSESTPNATKHTIMSSHADYVCVLLHNNALITTKANKMDIINTYTNITTHTHTNTGKHIHIYSKSHTTTAKLFIRALKSAELLSCDVGQLVLRSPLSVI